MVAVVGCSSWHRAQIKPCQPIRPGLLACVVCCYTTRISLTAQLLPVPRSCSAPNKLSARSAKQMSQRGPQWAWRTCNHTFKLVVCAWSGTMHAVGPAWCSAAVAATGCFCRMPKRAAQQARHATHTGHVAARQALAAAGGWWGQRVGCRVWAGLVHVQDPKQSTCQNTQ